MCFLPYLGIGCGGYWVCADDTDKAVAAIHNIEADISTIQGRVEQLLNQKCATEKRLSEHDDYISHFGKALQEHMASQQRMKTDLLQHNTMLTAFDKAPMAAKIIPQSAIPQTTHREEVDVDMASQSRSPSRPKRDAASSSNAPTSPHTRPRKKRRGSSDTQWYMELQPAYRTNVEELWTDAFMDELLVDWSVDRFEHLEQWIKEWSAKKMLQTLLSLKSTTSRNTRNRGRKTIM